MNLKGPQSQFRRYGVAVVQYLKLLRSYPASRSVPIIILGRQETDIDIAMGLEAGADDYIPGPISVVELHRRIRVDDIRHVFGNYELA